MKSQKTFDVHKYIITIDQILYVTPDFGHQMLSPGLRNEFISYL